MVVSHHGHHDFGVAAGIRGGIGRPRAIGSQRVRLLVAAVVYRNGMPRAKQVARHAGAHFSKSNESEIHNGQLSEPGDLPKRPIRFSHDRIK